MSAHRNPLGRAFGAVHRPTPNAFTLLLWDVGSADVPSKARGFALEGPPRV